MCVHSACPRRQAYMRWAGSLLPLWVQQGKQGGGGEHSVMLKGRLNNSDVSQHLNQPACVVNTLFIALYSFSSVRKASPEPLTIIIEVTVCPGSKQLQGGAVLASYGNSLPIRFTVLGSFVHLKGKRGVWTSIACSNTYLTVTKQLHVLSHTDHCTLKRATLKCTIWQTQPSMCVFKWLHVFVCAIIHTHC